MSKLLVAREAMLGEGMKIRRLLPHREQRMIGAWCFFDHAGPADVSQGRGLRVAPHPHTGLQTFSWMMDGEILHRDSLGYQQVLRKGEVNLMTAGCGISHSEESPEECPPLLQLAQFWIALPGEKSKMQPDFKHYDALPRIRQQNATITLLAGELLGQTSPVEVYSPLLGVDITTEGQTGLALPLNPDFEHGVAVLTGKAQVDGYELTPGNLLYLNTGRSSIDIDIKEASQIILLGGEPFAEEVILHWNFVGHNQDELKEYIRRWHETDYFGKVDGYDGEPTRSPELRSGR